MAQLGEHFQVKAGALLQPLCFHQLAFGSEEFQAFIEFLLDGFYRRQRFFRAG